MNVKTSLRSAAASDPGRRRKNNEDRFYTDPDRGIYAVIDGVGGHAAGERAAAVAVEVIKERLERPTGTPEQRLREAIALANNEIYTQARSRTDWNGMACVLTIALIEDDIVTVGHVGDSRLYLLRPGEIEKITHDHSPVGEREDRGEIGEMEAMKHSRRNEIFRDVGSGEKNPDDTGFIEVTSFPMPSDGALLLCSDGLSDLVPRSILRAGVERYATDLDAAAHALIDAANDAGGKDNITVVLVAAPDYLPEPPGVVTTTPGRSIRTPLPALAGLLAVALAVLVWMLWPASGPKTIFVNASGIGAALARAHSGDTVIIPQGRYRERIELREGITVRSQLPGMVTLTSPDGGPAVVARKIVAATLEGVWIQGDSQAPLSDGIDIIDSSPIISNVKVTGASTGIVVQGVSAPLITSSQIINNIGAGVLVTTTAKPRIESNLIAANGHGKPGVVKPGIEVGAQARPVLKDNGIVDNAAEPIWIHNRVFQLADYEENFFGGVPAKQAIRVVEDHP